MHQPRGITGARACLCSPVPQKQVAQDAVHKGRSSRAETGSRWRLLPDLCVSPTDSHSDTQAGIQTCIHTSTYVCVLVCAPVRHFCMQMRFLCVL